MTAKYNKWFYVALVAILVVVLDQASKLYFINFFKGNLKKEIVILPVLKIVEVWNRGVSFGMFSNLHNANFIFLGLSSLVVLFIFYLVHTSIVFLETLAYSLIIGGALGNMIDRLRSEAVFDFIYFHINDHYFPAFNVADSSICLGAGLFILSLIIYKKASKK